MISRVAHPWHDIVIESVRPTGLAAAGLALEKSFRIWLIIALLSVGVGELKDFGKPPHSATEFGPVAGDNVGAQPEAQGDFAKRKAAQGMSGDCPFAVGDCSVIHGCCASVAVCADWP
jgi:hypothetical protein